MIVSWEFPGVPPVPELNIPPTNGSDVHEWVRRQPTAQAMMYQFFTTGQINNTCGGPCVGIPNPSAPQPPSYAAQARERRRQYYQELLER